jgi:hypothetical protein
MDATVTTLVRDFNPATYNAATSQTQWTSSTGEVWTINTGTATTGYKGVLVDRTIVQGDGVNDFLLIHTAITKMSSFEHFTAFKGFNLVSNKNVVGDYGVGGNAFESGGLQVIMNLTNKLSWMFGNTAATTFRVGDVAYDYTPLTISNTRYSNGDGFCTTNRNNSADLTNTGITGTAIANSGTSSKMALFRGGEFNGTYSNSNLNTFILCQILDSTKRTAMYNYIRSINGNSF